MNEIKSKLNIHCDYLLYIDRVSLPTKAPTVGRSSEEKSFIECENYSIPMLIAATCCIGLACFLLYTYLKRRKSTITTTCPNTAELNEAPR